MSIKVEHSISTYLDLAYTYMHCAYLDLTYTYMHCAHQTSSCHRVYKVTSMLKLVYFFFQLILRYSSRSYSLLKKQLKIKSHWLNIVYISQAKKPYYSMNRSRCSSKNGEASCQYSGSSFNQYLIMEEEILKR